MVKKAASFVLASHIGSTYRKGTPRLRACCGRAGRLFWPSCRLPGHRLRRGAFVHAEATNGFLTGCDIVTLFRPRIIPATIY